MPTQPASPGLQRLATVALVYCAAIWGSTFFVVKDAVASLDPQLLVGYRFTLAAGLLLPVVAWRFMRSRQPVQHTAASVAQAPAPAPGWRAGLTLGLILWALYATQTAGLVWTTASNSGFITGLFIVFVPFLSWLLFGNRPGAVQVIAVGVALAGLALLTGGLSELNAGDALTLVAAVTYAWHVLLTDRYANRGHDPYVLCFVQMLLTGVLGLAGAWLLGARPEQLDPAVLRQVLFLTLFPTLSAFLLQLWAQRILPPLRVALIFLLEPVFGALFAWTLGGEQFIWLRACGGLVILGAMLLSELALNYKRT